MARQRASQARAAFARVGAAQVGESAPDEVPGEKASISASGIDIGNTGSAASGMDGGKAGDTAGAADALKASRIAGTRAGRSAGRKAGKTRRRVGRPRGPERVPVTVRLLAETNDRLTTAVDSTGESPQYIVERALTAYLDALGIPGSPRRPRSA